MRKLITIFAIACLLVGTILASSGNAQEAPLDLGEDEPLVAACAHLKVVGEVQGLKVRNCRRLTEDVVLGDRAIVHVRIATDQGPFELAVELRKSLWNVVVWY